jgi:hypothetical protein
MDSHLMIKHEKSLRIYSPGLSVDAGTVNRGVPRGQRPVDVQDPSRGRRFLVHELDLVPNNGRLVDVTATFDVFFAS